MNKKNEIFFSPEGKGLTCTSANHIANLAKEYIQNTESFGLSAMRFYKTTVNVIGSDIAHPVREGDTNEMVRDILKDLLFVAKAKALIAWLREAIKAHEDMLDNLQDIDEFKFCSLIGIQMPERPTMEKVLSEDDYYASLSVKDRNRYYELEAKASTIGKVIHKNGIFSKERASLNEIKKKPVEIRENGKDTLIYTHTPVASSEVVEEVFFTLQNEYREAQAELNSIKFKCEKAINESKIAVISEYNQQLKEYNAEMNKINNDLKLFIQKESVRIGNLKIIIPDSLKEIYNFISKLGK